jgi:glycerol uptake facilitator protein
LLCLWLLCLRQASVSGAHLNPAVTLALAMFRPLDVPWWTVVPYWIAQYSGAILGAVINLMIYGPLFRHYEAVHGIVRGSAESIATAISFGETFPNPGFAGVISESDVTPVKAMAIEAWGTAVLMFVILALTDPNQKLVRNKDAVPVYIGLTVAVLFCLYAPLTQAGCKWRSTVPGRSICADADL